MALLFETKTKQSYNNVAVVYSLWSEMFAFFCKKKICFGLAICI